MGTGTRGCHEAAADARSKGLLHTALKQLERAVQIAADDYERAFATYELGAFHFGEAGDGKAARECFEQAIEQWKVATLGRGRTRPPNVPVVANSAENLMLLSQSYEEFDRWADELRRAAPEEPVLHEHVPHVQQLREKGRSWAEVSLHYAMLAIRPNETGGGAQPASGACLFRLLIENRRRLRLSHEQWRTALMGYLAAMAAVLERADQLILRSTGRRKPYELAFAHRPAVRYLTEYCTAYPDDDFVEKARERAEEIERHNQASERDNELSSPPAFWATRLVLTSLAGVLGVALYRYLSPSWNLLSAIAAFTLGASCAAYGARRGRNPPARWRTTAAVKDGISSACVEGLQFRLVAYDVQAGNYLYLHFRPLQAVPSDQAHAAHLAVRCVVASTLPDVVARMSGVRLTANPAAGYTIDFGSGVTVPYYGLHARSETVTTLQVASEMENEMVHVYIHPSFGRIEDSQQNFMVNRSGLQAKLGEAFSAQLGDSVLTL